MGKAEGVPTRLHRRCFRVGNGAVPARLIVDFGVILYLGAIGGVPEHRCAGPVVAVGLEGDFEVALPDSTVRARSFRTLAHVPCTVDGFGRRMGVPLIDPGLEWRDVIDEPRALAFAERLSSQGLEAVSWRHE